MLRHAWAPGHGPPTCFVFMLLLSLGAKAAIGVDGNTRKFLECYLTLDANS